MTEQREEATPIQAFVGWVAIISIIALCFGAYHGAVWFLATYGTDGVNGVLSGLILALASEAGILYLCIRATDADARKRSPRRAAGRRSLYWFTIYLSPIVLTVAFVAILIEIIFSDPVILGSVVFPDVAMYLIGFFWIVAPRLFSKHAGFHPKLFCEHCSKHVPTDAVWVCGDCGHENRDSFSHSFLQRCEHCDSFPRTYICPHSSCGSPIDLGEPPRAEGRMSHHPARMWTEEPNVEPEETAEEVLRRRAKEVEALDHQIRISRMNADLAAVEKERKKNQPMNARETLEQSLAVMKQRHLDVHEIADRERQLAKEHFKRGSIDRQRVEAVVETWKEEQLGKGLSDGS